MRLCHRTDLSAETGGTDVQLQPACELDFPGYSVLKAMLFILNFSQVRYPRQKYLVSLPHYQGYGFSPDFGIDRYAFFHAEEIFVFLRSMHVRLAV